MTELTLSLITDESVEEMIEVEQRPPLYNKELKEYSDANLKQTLWEQICEKLIPTWDMLDAPARYIQVKEAKRKWENLRGSFRRELRNQKKN